MKRYEEYTEEEIEDLARECERLAEEVGWLQDQVYHLTKRLRDLPHNGATPRTEPPEIASGFDLPF